MESFKAAASVWASPVISVEAGRTVEVWELDTDVWTDGVYWPQTVTNVFEYDEDEVSP